MKKKEFYSIPELAKLIGISRIAVFKKVKKGQIKASKIGKNYVIPANVALAFGEEETTEYGKKNGSIVIYEQAGLPVIEVNFINNNIWLTQLQIAILFGTKRPAITKHIKNIIDSGELKADSVSSILELTASDGKKYKTSSYSLDMIISVGYRVNSVKATQFRIWATKILSQHIKNGFTLNERRLKEKSVNLRNLRTAVKILSNATTINEIKGMENELINIISNYSSSLNILQSYDDMNLKRTGESKPLYKLSYEDAFETVERVKAEYKKEGKTSVLFGTGLNNRLKSLIGAINQTFEGRELYPTVEEKAAHLLYFVVKDHPFTDGNKRLAAILFLHYMSKNRMLYLQNGEKRVSDGALAAITLLAAVSNPNEKQTMIDVITNAIR